MWHVSIYVILFILLFCFWIWLRKVFDLLHLGLALWLDGLAKQADAAGAAVVVYDVPINYKL